MLKFTPKFHQRPAIENTQSFYEIDGKREASISYDKAVDGDIAGLLSSRRPADRHFDSKTETELLDSHLALNNRKELAAWLAHDVGHDVVLLRKGATFDDASLLQLMQDLDAHGLMPDHRELSFYTCRNSRSSDPHYGVAVNPAKGSPPTVTVAVDVPHLQPPGSSR